jgi:hypothetical protein
MTRSQRREISALKNKKSYQKMGGWKKCSQDGYNIERMVEEENQM